MNTKYEKLLEPGRIGSVKTRNRIFKSGAGMLMWHEDDLHMSEEVKAFYEGIARGGVGLLIVESPTIDYPYGVRWKERYRLDDDRYIQGLSELVDVIHKHGCPTFLQMNHDGPWQVKLPFVPEPMYDGPPLGASPICFEAEGDFHNEPPRALTVEEIEEIVDKFASAAVRAQKAGFDGVDINAASSHLLHNFFSPFFNRREDAYGGSIENRARFAMEVIREIKKRLGRDFPVSMIMNGRMKTPRVSPDAWKRRARTPSRSAATFWDITSARIFPISSSTPSLPYPQSNFQKPMIRAGSGREPTYRAPQA
jgi:2,4-dienoyl-CoA reductase-like NADH-dependent reductase (Old Yellow Enzyme family)